MKSIGPLHFSALSQRLVTTLLLLTTAAFASGCSGGMEPLEKELKALQSEVNRVRSANLAIQDRLDALEVTALAEAKSDEEQGDSDRPVLEVVRLTPDDALVDEAPVVASPQTAGPRPVIHGDDGGVEQFDDAEQAATAADKRKRKQLARRWRKANR